MKKRRKLILLIGFCLLIGLYQQLGAGDPRPCLPGSVCSFLEVKSAQTTAQDASVATIPLPR